MDAGGYSKAGTDAQSPTLDWSRPLSPALFPTQRVPVDRGDAMPGRFSLPKDKIKVLLVEGISQAAADHVCRPGLFQRRAAAEGARCRRRSGRRSRASTSSGIRSRTELTADALSHADRLIAAGCFSVGTDQVDLAAARKAGRANLQCAVLQHALRGGADDRRDRHAVPPHLSRDPALPMPASGTSLRPTASRCAARCLASSATATSAASSRTWPRRWACASSITTRRTSCVTATRNRRGTLAELLAMADVVSLHVPETPATAGMIGARQSSRR